MAIDKQKALKEIDEKLHALIDLLVNAGVEDMWGNEYQHIYAGTKMLLEQLFGAQEKDNFELAVGFGGVIVSAFGKSEDEVKTEQLDGYKKHLESCIAQLEVYKERVLKFWEEGLRGEAVSAKPLVFVSKSFADEDKKVNSHFEAILKALKIEFETGERYSDDSIPQKVRDRIHNSDLMTLILTCREKLESGGYAPPSWLIKEVGHAQQEGKPVIVLIEKGIRDDASLKMEKELIYFERDNFDAMNRSTIKFLEALKEHKLV